MKDTNVNEGIMGKVAQKVADRLSVIPADPFICWFSILFEPEIPDEIIRERQSSN